METTSLTKIVRSCFSTQIDSLPQYVNTLYGISKKYLREREYLWSSRRWFGDYLALGVGIGIGIAGIQEVNFGQYDNLVYFPAVSRLCYEICAKASEYIDSAKEKAKGKNEETGLSKSAKVLASIKSLPEGLFYGAGGGVIGLMETVGAATFALNTFK